MAKICLELAKGEIYWKDMVSCDSRLYKQMLGRMGCDVAGPKVYLYLDIWLSYQKCQLLCGCGFQSQWRSTLIYAFGNMPGYQDLDIFLSCSPFSPTSTTSWVYFVIVFTKTMLKLASSGDWNEQSGVLFTLLIRILMQKYLVL